MKKSLLCIICLLAAITLNAQTFQWAKSFGGTSDKLGVRIFIDATGNIYTTGSFRGTVDFDPGTGVYNLTSVGQEDVFIQKLDPSGNFLWAKSFGGTGKDNSCGFIKDSWGNFYVAGYFEGTADFDPGPGTVNVTSAGSSDVFVMMLSASGNLIWINRFGGTGIEVANTLAMDNNGNLYTGGYFEGTVDFDPGASGIYNLTSAGGYDAFVQKMTSGGIFVWAKSFGSSGDDQVNSVAINASGDIFSTGIFSGTVDFNPGAGVYNVTSAGGTDAYIEKLDGSGVFQWARTFGGTLDDRGGAITTDGSGNIYTTGSFQGTVDFDPGIGTSNASSNGGKDIFIQKLNSMGVYVWARVEGGPTFDFGTSVATDVVGNVYLTGDFSGTVDFDPGLGILNLTAVSSSNVFIQKFNAAGSLQWVNSFDGLYSSYIITPASGGLYTLGGFNGTVDFDPGPAVYNMTSSINSADIFIQKLSQTTGIAMPMNNIISLSPNPTKGTFQISLAQGLSKAELIITDLLGKEIFTKTYNNLLNTNIEVEGASGLYFLTIKTPDGQSTVKLIKE